MIQTGLKRISLRELTTMSNKLYPQIPSDDESDSEIPVTPTRRTTIEERHFGTIPGSAEATAAALAHHGAYANPIVERGYVTKKTQKKTKVKTRNKITSTICVLS